MPVKKIDINMEFRQPVCELFALLSDHEKMEPILGANVKRTRDGKDSLNGLGSVRTLNIGPLPSFDETVTAFRKGQTRQIQDHARQSPQEPQGRHEVLSLGFRRFETPRHDRVRVQDSAPRTRRPRGPRKLNPQRAEEAAGVIITCRTSELPVPSFG